MLCPKCKIEISGEIICDNDCQTIICQQCNSEFHSVIMSGRTLILLGHNPLCGIDDDDD